MLILTTGPGLYLEPGGIRDAAIIRCPRPLSILLHPGGQIDSPCSKAQDPPILTIYSTDSWGTEIELTNDMGTCKTSSLHLTREPGQLRLEPYEEARCQSWPWSTVCGYSQRRNWAKWVRRQSR